MTDSAAHTSYDDVPYPGYAYPQSHPDHIATLAILLGMDAPPVDQCRVLELGCADGSNILPLAMRFPASTFVGIDAAASQIAEGQAIVDALELQNLTLTHMNILDVRDDFGQFDYIIAHGIYAWVPSDVRDHILMICQRNLAPNGVAYVSYNAYPGWHPIQAIREMLRYRTRDIEEPQARIQAATDLIDLLAETGPQQNNMLSRFLGGYADFLKHDLEAAKDHREGLLFHDLLEAVNEPVYFTQFVEHAAQHGLQYLAESDFSTVMPQSLAPEVLGRLSTMARSGIELEQYMDFVRGRAFRRTLLCHEEVALDRILRPRRLAKLHIASQAVPVSPVPDVVSRAVEQFRSPNGATLSLEHPVTKAAMLRLGTIWPHSMPFERLLDEARTQVQALAPSQELPDLAVDRELLSGYLLQAFCYSPQLARLSTCPPPIGVATAERPSVTPLARLEARKDMVVTNLLHENVQLDPFGQCLVNLLDGNHDRAALREELLDMIAQGRLALQGNEGVQHPTLVKAVDDALEQTLHTLEKTALLVETP